MNWWIFILNSLLLGVGLTMDAFSVSLANGFNEPDMSKGKMTGIASTFAIFQFAMPMIGWICVQTIAEKFKAFTYAIPWIALILLGFIGGKMIVGFIKSRHESQEEEVTDKRVGFWGLMVQGVATAIDALSVGFTLNEDAPLLSDWYVATICAAIIGVVTFVFCIVGVFLGKKFGTKFSKYAELIGGIILVAIGIEIFVSNMISLYA